MQPCTPPRKTTCWVNGHGVFTVPGRHSHHSKQFDGQLSLSATNTRPHRSIEASMCGGRSLALDHGLVYLHRTGGQHPPNVSAITLAPRHADTHHHRSTVDELTTTRYHAVPLTVQILSGPPG